MSAIASTGVWGILRGGYRYYSRRSRSHFWMGKCRWVCPPNFEGLLPLCTKDTILPENPQGGTMYIILHGLGERWKPFAYFFAVVGLIGTLCVMPNQLVESVTTVHLLLRQNRGLGLRFVMGIVISLVVGAVIIGGIRRISVISFKIVPVMVTCYMPLILCF